MSPRHLRNSTPTTDLYECIGRADMSRRRAMGSMIRPDIAERFRKIVARVTVRVEHEEAAHLAALRAETIRQLGRALRKNVFKERVLDGAENRRGYLADFAHRAYHPASREVEAMNRRAFVTGLGAVLAAPRAAEAQQAGKVYQVGYLGVAPPTASTTPLWDAFVHGLREHGYVEGRNLVLHRRYSGGQDARFAELAAELVRLNVDVIVSSTTQGALAAKQATSTIPIVTIVAGDPVGSGLVTSLARPGGNVTGVTTEAKDWAAKQVQLLQEVAPEIKRVGVLWNPTLPQHQAFFRETQQGAATLRLKLDSLELRSVDELEAVFQRIAHTRLDGLQVYDQPALFPHRQRVVDWVTRSRIPAIYGFPTYVDIGGLMSYSPKLLDLFRRSTTYVDKLLKGAKVSELPMEQPTTFEFVVNLKTARALGLTIPPSLLLRADQVIE
jgi:putative ABC transport system substrate-binding protein